MQAFLMGNYARMKSKCQHPRGIWIFYFIIGQIPTFYSFPSSNIPGFGKIVQQIHHPQRMLFGKTKNIWKLFL